MRYNGMVVALLAVASSLESQPTRFATVRRLILDEMASGNPPGLAVAVARGDSILWEEGFGWANSETKVRVTAHTPFYTASVTKAMVATAAMILHERGRLELDRPANDYLGNAKLWSPSWDVRGATVRRLATHTAGLSTFDLDCAANRPACQVPGIDERIAKYGVLVWPAGEHFDYSNLGYHVFGEIVARTAGRDLASFLRDQLFRPLGMTRSSLGVDPALVGQTAVAYSWTRGALPLVPGATSSSSIYASAHDLVLFGMMHAKVRRPGVRAPVSDAAIDTMQHPVLARDSTGHYGFGWSVEDDRFGYRSLLAQGGTDAAQAWLRIVPSERIIVAVVANKGVGLAQAVVDSVLGELLPRYAEAAAKARASTNASSPTAAARLDSMFTGAWRGTVRAEAGELPLDVDISEAGSVRAKVGRSPDERGGSARFGRRLFVVRIPGGLDTQDTTAGRRLSLYLRPRDGVMNGVLTTFPSSDSGLVGQLSYWVELRKRR